MTLGISPSLQDLRTHMLNNILWVLAIAMGISVALSIVEETRQQRYLLAIFYALAYSAVVVATANKSINYHLRAFVPLVILYGVALSEFIYFGTTSLAYVFMYTLIIFTGLLYGNRAAFLSVALIVITISTNFWYRQYQISLDTAEPLFTINYLLRWLSPMLAFLACAAIAMAAISMMLKQLSNSLADKSRLVEELTREIENNRQTQEALQASEGQYSALFKRSNDAVFLIDTITGKYLQANLAAQLLTGLSLEEILKRTVRDVFPASSNEILHGARNSTSTEELGEIVFERADGIERVAEMHTTMVSDGLSFLIAHDVSANKKLEEQFIHSQKMEAVGQLAGGVAHDFNNSLQAIQIFGETAHQKTNDKQVRSDLGNILGAAEKAQSLVKQLLAFSRRQVLQMEVINVASTIDELLNLIRPIIGEHIKLEFDPHSKPMMIEADRVQIEQIIMNLCLNARDAMGAGGTLSITLDAIVCGEECCQENTWASRGKFIRLRVTDNGSGIDEAVRLRMFEPFYTTKEVGKGTGLGLSTVFGIIRQHKGFINVHSEPGKGSTFEVFLPQVVAVETAKKIEHETELKNGTETILVADDDDFVRAAMEAMLTLSGYTVMTATTGDEAIEIFDQNKDKLELVILDVVMPNNSGESVSKHITDSKKDIPILFVSGYSRDVVHTDFVLDEGVHFIQKPYRRAALLNKVRDLIDHKAA